MRTNALPLSNASLVPKNEPNTLKQAIGIAYLNTMCPVLPKYNKLAKLVATFNTFAFALACKKSFPRNAINTKMKKVPVPGPINPS